MLQSLSRLSTTALAQGRTRATSLLAHRRPSSSTTTMASTARLTAVRTQLDKHNLQAYIVDSGDAHSNEYNAPLDDRRAWLSGFSGSAGTAIVLRDQAFLWTDGRYHQVRLAVLTALLSLLDAQPR